MGSPNNIVGQFMARAILGINPDGSNAPRWLALYTTVVVGDAYRSVEVSGEGYARAPITFRLLPATQEIAALGLGGPYYENRETVAFPQARGDWGHIEGFGIADQPSGPDSVMLIDHLEAIAWAIPGSQVWIVPGQINNKPKPGEGQ